MKKAEIKKHLSFLEKEKLVFVEWVGFPPKESKLPKRKIKMCSFGISVKENKKEIVISQNIKQSKNKYDSVLELITISRKDIKHIIDLYAYSPIASPILIGSPRSRRYFSLKDLKERKSQQLLDHLSHSLKK